ncbi:hypothetical protein QBC35DRAFT_75231 [Podospora australis]|uniref:Uncharacterized protein n=1 Tax=Podospora australis TaxID=1536484 RepID=A0AAN7ALL7_9PEZI|nr:hypothetical protein QBC35DRAFT_75231 [Podospora australis]
MGLIDDAASAISTRTSGSRRSKSHREGGGHREHRKHRDKKSSRSRSRSRDSRHSRSYYAKSAAAGGGGGGGGSTVGGGGGDYYSSSRAAPAPSKGGAFSGIASFFGGGDDDLDVDGFGYGEDYSGSYYDRSHKSSSKHKDREHRDRDRGIDDDAKSFFSGIGIGGGGGGDGHSSSKDRGFFGLTGGNVSRSSFFSGFGGRSGTPAPSYYKRSPRANFVSRMTKKAKRLLRDLVYYAKRHPLKVFMVIIMPLVTGGFLTALLAKVGIRLPKFVERMLGMAAKASTGDSIGLVGEAVKMVSGSGGGGGKRGGGGIGGILGGGGGSGGGLGGAAVNYAKTTFEKGSNGGIQWERRSVEKDFLEGNAGGAAMKGIAKMFS